NEVIYNKYDYSSKSIQHYCIRNLSECFRGKSALNDDSESCRCSNLLKEKKKTEENSEEIRKYLSDKTKKRNSLYKYKLKGSKGKSVKNIVGNKEGSIHENTDLYSDSDVEYDYGNLFYDCYYTEGLIDQGEENEEEKFYEAREDFEGEEKNKCKIKESEKSFKKENDCKVENVENINYERVYSWELGKEALTKLLGCSNKLSVNN
ncbi:hypothetical protein PFNF54_00791, partial [Plasmodium falciparum NF54]